MKPLFCVALFGVLASPCLAQEGGIRGHKDSAPAADVSSDVFSETKDAKITGWGKAIDPDKDCKFFRSKSALIISTPAAQHPHDFSPELGWANAPRVVRSVAGDFSFQVKVDDRLNPGDESMVEGRFGYHGAVVAAIADDQNAVTLARAMFKESGDKGVPYANFEMRVNGELLRIGLTGDHPLPETGPVYLRLERRGQLITGSVSIDGSHWDAVGSANVPDDWTPKLKVGTMVVNTSKADFSPQFSQGQLSK